MRITFGLLVVGTVAGLGTGCNKQDGAKTLELD
jgi:hypothetical protein